MTPDDMEEHLEAVARALGDGDFTRVTFPEGVAKKTATAIRALLLDYQERGRALEELRDSLLGIALSDRYRRYPKQHEDGGVRGQSGLRAVRALTGQHGSYLTDDDVVRLDKAARATLKGKSHD
jgi:hypothetical protein